MRAYSRPKKPIFTIGHSTRSIAEFTKLLQAHGVQQLVDIRTIPRSRRNPQFNANDLASALKSAGIRYVHLKELGGLRHAKPDSVNAGWRNGSFRGYADYMQTPEFEEALAKAIELATQETSALMCAEAVPWRCHRSLVADALIVRGYNVQDIVGASGTRPHKLTSFAHASKKHITYPGDNARRLKPARLQKKGVQNTRGGIQIARVYDKPGDSPAARYFVERLWPRGIRKEKLRAEWLKDVAPSSELRQWFAHKPERWDEFKKRYRAELRANPNGWKPILESARKGGVTLLYSAKDRDRNSALLLQKFLASKMRSRHR